MVLWVVAITLKAEDNCQKNAMLFYILEKYFLNERCILFPFFFWRNGPQWARAYSFTRFLNHTQRRSTVVRTVLTND